PEYVGVHEKLKYSTPQKLAQHYMVVELPQKLDMLFSFIKTHLSSKTIVFLSSGKQVRFVFEAFCKIKPGVPLLHLHGKQKQMKRIEIFDKFKNATKAVLFCTDVAARGLDFPAVDWVVQVDCPEDCDTYLHRVGRTARYEAAGKSLLFLLPSEASEMTRLMEERKIPIKEISPKSNKVMTVTKQLQHFCFQDPEIKYLGQRAFVTYVRSVFLQKNKAIFKVDEMPLDEYAESLGLPGAPQIKFVKRSAAKNKSYDDVNTLPKEERERLRRERMAEIEEENAPVHDEGKVKTKVDKMFARKNAGVLANHYQKLVENNESSSDEDFITLKRADHALSSDDQSESEEDEPVVKTVAVNPDTGMPVVIPNIPSQEMSKRQLRKVKEKIIKNTRNTRIVFDDDGNARPLYELKNEESFREQGDVRTQVDEFQQRNLAHMEQADIQDREMARQKRREKRLAKKIREREEMGLDQSDYEDAPVLGGASDEDGHDYHKHT
ncbi:ATP-dependent RNA helicase dbp4, partial [Coemansia brasiliensis]